MQRLSGIEHLSALIDFIQARSDAGEHHILRDVLASMAKWAYQWSRITSERSAETITRLSLRAAVKDPEMYKECCEMVLSQQGFSGGARTTPPVRQVRRRRVQSGGVLKLDPHTPPIHIGSDITIVHILQGDEHQDPSIQTVNTQTLKNEIEPLCHGAIQESYINKCYHSSNINGIALYIKDELSSIAFCKVTKLRVNFVPGNEPRDMDVMELCLICSNKKGSKVIQYLLDMPVAEQERIFGNKYHAVYLEAIPDAVGFYERLGFDEVYSVDREDLGDLEPMWAYTTRNEGVKSWALTKHAISQSPNDANNSYTWDEDNNSQAANNNNNSNGNDTQTWTTNEDNKIWAPTSSTRVINMQNSNNGLQVPNSELQPTSRKIDRDAAINNTNGSARGKKQNATNNAAPIAIGGNASKRGSSNKTKTGVGAGLQVHNKDVVTKTGKAQQTRILEPAPTGTSPKTCQTRAYRAGNRQPPS